MRKRSGIKIARCVPQARLEMSILGANDQPHPLWAEFRELARLWHSRVRILAYIALVYPVGNQRDNKRRRSEE